MNRCKEMTSIFLNYPQKNSQAKDSPCASTEDRVCGVSIVFIPPWYQVIKML